MHKVVTPSGDEQRGHPVLWKHYLEGVQDSAIVVDHHRVSLLALEARETLRWGEEQGFRRSSVGR